MINILIVDDLASNRQDIIKRLNLLQDDITIFECVDGAQVFDILPVTKIDIILLDIILPTMNGFEVCKKIRNTTEWKYIPIIMITSYKNENDIKKKAIEAGTDSYLTRPINNWDLISQVNIAIRLKKAEDIIREKNIKLEKGLSLSEKKYKDLFNTMSNAFVFFEVIFDKNNNPIDYIFLEVNPAFIKLTKTENIDLVGYSLVDKLPQINDWIINYDYVIKNNQSNHFIGEMVKNDERMWYDVLCYTTKNKYLAVLLTDITTQVNNNEKVNRIGNELDQILNTSSPICVVLNDNTIYLVNESFCLLFNVNRESVIGKPCSTIFNDHCTKKLNKQKYTYETSFRLNNEKIIKCLVTASLFVNYNNETVGVVKTFTDITKLKRIEKKLIKAKKKAEESDKLKSSFLSNMSHELRSPMNSILGFSDLLLDNTLDIKTKDSYLDIIQNAGTDLLKLIDDIIDVAKMEASQIKLNYESLNLNQMLHEIYIMFNENVNLKMNNVSLNVSIDDSVINDTIFTDGLRLKQVLVNLISNAIKFTHCGSINFGYVKKNNNLEFYIKDTGIGLTKQQINIIWERFRQADDSTTKKYGGTGLGLSISKGLVNLLGGEIWVDSEYNKGTNFYFSIPYIESAIKDEIINSKNCIYDWSDFTILVAEDVDANYYLLREYLKYTKVKIMRTRNGKETVSVYRKNKKNINLILMDIQMPVMNGTQAMTKIKSINSDVSIIIQSAYAMSEDIKKGFDFGCDDYVTKPILKSELLRKINNLLFK